MPAQAEAAAGPPPVSHLEEALASADGRETGGILLGHGPDHSGRIRITEAGRPGPLAVRREDYFLRDLEHARALAAAAWARERALWIGEWHTHPHGDPRPSSRDLETYAHLLAAGELEFGVVVSAILVADKGSGWESPGIAVWVIRGRS